MLEQLLHVGEGIDDGLPHGVVPGVVVLHEPLSDGEQAVLVPGESVHEQLGGDDGALLPLPLRVARGGWHRHRRAGRARDACAGRRVTGGGFALHAADFVHDRAGVPAAGPVHRFVVVVHFCLYAPKRYLLE